MCRLRRLFLIMVAAVATLTPAVCAQASRSDALETYLASRSLDGALAAHLRSRLAATSGDERSRTAETLGALYVRMLERASTSDERQSLETHCRSLLEIVPEADSFELRINLAKTTYLQAEEMAERERLLLASSEEKAEAERVLRQVGETLESIAAKVGRRVEALERQETSARDTDIEAIRLQLGDARRLRSLARYYAGWTEYYLALLTGTPQRCVKAMEHFGVILGAPSGRAATLDRASQGMLRYEHVARAAIGCALASSLLGNDSEAIRWIEAVEYAEGLSPAVASQIFGRKITIYGAARRWADVEAAVRRQREPERGKPIVHLNVGEARLLAVTTLGASRKDQDRPMLREAAGRLAQIAFADLVAKGEIGHVVDLVQKFGTMPLGDEGFITAFVRGVQAFEKAREAHKASGKDPEAPADSTELINDYREAARLLAGVESASDAAAFAGELGKARIRRGLALYYAGDLEKAAEQFQSAAQPPASSDLRRDALWYGIVSLDLGVERGKPSLSVARDGLAMVYLKEFPATPNAAKLLLRQTGADLVPDEKAIEILLGIEKSAPIYEAARRQAARLLYGAYRRSPPSRRDFAALRFAEVAEEALQLEAARALTPADPGAKDAADAVVVRVRQLADALLGMSAPDVARVQNAFHVLEGVAHAHSLDLASLAGELAYRRLQIGLATSDEALVRRSEDELLSASGPYVIAADRLLFRRASERFALNPGDAEWAKRVVRYGVRVLDAAKNAMESPDATSAALRNGVSRAAAALWNTEQDTTMRDLCLRLEKAQIAAGLRTAEGLRRLAEMADTAGEESVALDAWRELSVGLEPTSEAWFEARYHSLRLLAAVDPVKAREGMLQHKVLYPSFGPEPWGSLLRDLDAAMATPGGTK